MQLLFIAVLSLSIAWVLHILWWKVCLPIAHTKALLILFTVVFGFCLMVCFLLSYVGILQFSIYNYLHFTLFYVPVSLAYISAYSLIEEQSPSMLILELLEKSTPEGLSKNDIEGTFSAADVISQRLDAAVNNGLLKQEDKELKLTKKGEFLARVFDKAAQLYKLNEVG